MAELVSAVEQNDLDSLRRLIDLEKALDPNYDPKRMPYTEAMQRANIAAVRHNNLDALGILFDAGCTVNVGGSPHRSDLIENNLADRYLNFRCHKRGYAGRLQGDIRSLHCAWLGR